MTDPSGLTPDQLKAQIQQNDAQVAKDVLASFVAPLGGTIPGATPLGSGGAGGGFQFSPEEIEDQLTKCGTLLQALGDRVKDAEDAAKHFSFAPAADPVSQKMAQAHTQWAQDGVTYLQNRVTAMQQWIDQLTQAKANYMKQESLTQDQWHRLTLGLEP